MDVHVTPRRAGKTSRALAWLVLDPENRVIVTISRQEAHRLLREARRLYPWAKVTERNFLGPDPEESKVRTRGRNVEVYADNAETLLRYLYGNVVAASATGQTVTSEVPPLSCPLDGCTMDHRVHMGRPWA